MSILRRVPSMVVMLHIFFIWHVHTRTFPATCQNYDKYFGHGVCNKMGASMCFCLTGIYTNKKKWQEVSNAYWSLLEYEFIWLLCWNWSTLDKINSFCIHFHISIMFTWISYSQIYEPIIISVVVNVNFNCYANATFPVVSPVICAVAQSVYIMKYVLHFSCILHEILLSKFRWSSSIHFMDKWSYTHVLVWCNYLSIQFSLRRFC